MVHRYRRAGAVAAAASLLAAGASAQAIASPAKAGKHVLLLSVDGLHQSDLAWYVKAHPASALAALVSAASSSATQAHRSRRTRSPAWWRR